MSGPINASNYPTLYKYAILTQTGITSGATTIVNNGFYGNGGGPSQITGTFIAGTPPSGENDTDVVSATTQLGTPTTPNTLIGDITTYTNTLPNPIPPLNTAYGGVNLNILPNTNYTNLICK